MKCFKNSKFYKHRNSFQVLYILFTMTQGRWKQSILSVTINLGYENNYEDETRAYPSMVSINTNYCVKPIISDCQNVYCFIFPNLTQFIEPINLATHFSMFRPKVKFNQNIRSSHLNQMTQTKYSIYTNISFLVGSEITFSWASKFIFHN